MRRALGFVMVVGLLVLGASACGVTSDITATGDTVATTAGGPGTTDGGSSGNDAVDAYCQSVRDFVDKYKAAEGDPGKLATLATESQKLSEKARDLTTEGLSADEAQAVADCTKDATDVLSGGPGTTEGTDTTESSETTEDTSDTTPETDSTEPPDTSGSSNSKVDQYCKAVKDYVAKVKAAQNDPSKLGSLAQDAQELSAKAQELLTGLTAADAQKLTKCTQEATEALTGG